MEGVAPPGAPTGRAGPAGVSGRAGMVVAGHRRDESAARRGRRDPDPAVRAAALGALVRMGAARSADLTAAFADPAAAVRRRAAEAAAAFTGRGTRNVVAGGLRALLADADALVVEAACWSLGERRDRPAVVGLSLVAAAHDDTRCREAAVAALGAIGDPTGLAAVLDRLGDKPTVRRRAVVALAAFSGPRVDAALAACRADRDWQVRQAAESLLDE